MDVMTKQSDEQRRETRWSANKKTDAKDGLRGRTVVADGMTVEQRRRLREAERKVGELTLDNDILRVSYRV